MGYGGMAAVLVAMLAALTALPALLAVLGPRINALRVPLPRWRRATADGAQPAEGGWARLARSVMRRPVLYLIAVSVVLLALAAPFLRASFGGFDERVLPEGTPSRTVAERLAERVPRRQRRPGARPGLGGRPAGRPGLRRPRPPTLPNVTGAQVTANQRRLLAGRRRLRRASRLGGRPARWSATSGRCRRRPAPRSSSAAARRPTWTRSTSLTSRLRLDGALRRGGDVPAAVLRLRLGRAAAQGDPHERRLDRRVVRRGGLDLPGRSPGRPARASPRPASSSRPTSS